MPAAPSQTYRTLVESLGVGRKGDTHVLAAVQGAGAEQPLVTTLVTTDTGIVRVLTTGGSVTVLPPPEGQFGEGPLTVMVSVDGEGGVGHPVGGIGGSEGPQSVMVTGGEGGGQDSPLGGGDGPQEVTVLVILGYCQQREGY
jgi:hypothetical protein